jgi:predicted lipoprotein with Yx(FWY)xxD motif
MRRLTKISIPAIAVSLLIAACGSSSSSSTTKVAAATPPAAPASNASASSTDVVKTASSSLGTILVDAKGMTLYSLSAERNGKFICTSSACLGAWHPLTISAGSAPSGGVGSLGTVKRPEGTLQVTYKGMPLYTFAQDTQAGQTSGQGIKDVGTWSVIRTGSGSAPSTSTTSSGSSGGYSY